MKFKLIYPRWEKLEGQTIFNLPPHGPVVMAAEVPKDWEIDFTDENYAGETRLGNRRRLQETG
jgi:hypothetical protein